MAVKKKTTRGKQKPMRQVSEGNLYIHATYNNTIITATDLNGNTLAWASAGHCGFKGPKKSTPYAASMIIKKLAEKLEGSGLRELHVYAKGVGSGRDSAIRTLNANNFNVVSIEDVTPIPHNGCRPPKPRRI